MWDKRVNQGHFLKKENKVQINWVGDSPKDLELVLFCDADFAGDLTDSKSTGGAFLFLVGPNTFVPISWMVKKQGQISHSSTEAEVISLDTALRLEGIPAIALWDEIVEVFSPESQKHAKP